MIRTNPSCCHTRVYVCRAKYANAQEDAEEGGESQGQLYIAEGICISVVNERFHLLCGGNQIYPRLYGYITYMYSYVARTGYFTADFGAWTSYRVHKIEELVGLSIPSFRACDCN